MRVRQRPAADLGEGLGGGTHLLLELDGALAREHGGGEL